MRIVLEALHELLNVLVDVGVVGDVVCPLLHLRLGGQLSVGDQVRRFQESAPFRQLLDRVAAVFENAAVAVDVGDGAATGGGILERGVVHHQPEILVGGLHLAEVHRLDGPVRDRDLVRPPRAVVGDGQRILFHGGSSAETSRAFFALISTTLCPLNVASG